MTEKANESKIRGNAFFSQSNWPDAIKEYTDAINLDPAGHVYYSNRSACYAEIGDFPNALKDAEKCVELKPDWPKAHSRRGHALFKLQRLEEAAEAYQNGLNLEPENDSLKEGLRLAEASANAGGGNPLDLSQMMGNLKNTIAADPETRAFLRDPAFVQKLENIQRDPQTYFPMYLGDPQMKKVMGLMFRSLGLNLGDVSDESESVPRRKSRTDDITEDATMGNVSSDQKLAEEKKDAGNAAYKARDLDKAIALYTEAVSLAPKNITYLTNRATARLAKGEMAAAREDCEEAIRVGRAEQAPFRAIAKAFERLADADASEGKAEAALAMYGKAQLESSSEGVKRKMRKIEGKEAERRKIEYLDSQKALENKERGNEFFKASKWKEALDEYTESLKRNPEDSKVYCNRAAVYSKLMFWENALNDCKESIQRDETFAKAYLRKGKIEHFLKEYHKAIMTFNKALEFEPSSVQLIEAKAETLQTVMALSREGKFDQDFQAKALQDKEVQNLMADEKIREVLEDMKTNSAAGHAALKNPAVMRKIEVLMAAGVVQFA